MHISWGRTPIDLRTIKVLAIFDKRNIERWNTLCYLYQYMAPISEYTGGECPHPPQGECPLKCRWVPRKKKTCYQSWMNKTNSSQKELEWDIHPPHLRWVPPIPPFTHTHTHTHAYQSEPPATDMCSSQNGCIMKQLHHDEQSMTKGSSHGSSLLWITLLVAMSLIARFMGPTWGPSGANRTQVGPMLAPWTWLSGVTLVM